MNVVLFEKKYPPLNYKISGALINGIKEGLWVTYDSLGRVETEETFINGKNFGVVKAFSDGVLIEKTSDVLIKMDTISSFEKYNFNGQIITKGQFINGKKRGIWLYYFNDGKKLKKKVKYIDGGGETLYDARPRVEESVN